MNIIAIIQARMGSERLPGKVLKTLGGRPILEWVVRRLQQSQRIHQVVVATTDKAQDDAIVALCQTLEVAVFRGSEQDVLDRFYQAAQAYHADVIVRICSDCPLIDSTLIDHMLQQYCERNPSVDYLSNTLERTFPRGLDAEIFSQRTLTIAHQQAHAAHEREHVTPYVYEHPEIFTIAQYKNPIKNEAHFRWTLDTQEDFQFLESLISHVSKEAPWQTTTEEWREILTQHATLLDINAHVKQKILAVLPKVHIE